MVLVALAITIGGLAACGQQVAPGTAGSGGGTHPTGAGSSAGSTVLRGVGTVLESPDHGPQLCLGGVDDSYPPQCTGVELVGWDWSAVEAESANGSTWGNFAVTGAWDGTRMTVTTVGAPEDVPGRSLAGDPNFATPCEAPAGGWVVVDAATATDDAMQRALAAAALEPDYGGGWVDQSINPASDDGTDNDASMNDPMKLVLNLMFTGDLDRHETAMRAIWGGPLCVSAAPRSQAELLEIQSALTQEPGVLSSAPNDRAGMLEVSVVVDDGLQARMDDRYGEGVVIVIPSLFAVG